MTQRTSPRTNTLWFFRYSDAQHLSNEPCAETIVTRNILAAAALIVGALTITAGAWHHTQAVAADQERDRLLKEFDDLTGSTPSRTSARMRKAWTHSEMAKSAIQFRRQMKATVLMARALDRRILRVESMTDEHRFEGYLALSVGLLLSIAGAVVVARRPKAGDAPPHS